MEHEQSEKMHLIAYADIRLIHMKEDGMSSLQGRLLTPATFHNFSTHENAWSCWYIFETRTRVGETARVPMAILFDDRAPTQRLLHEGNTFTVFIDGATFGEGTIVDVVSVTESDFRRIFHFDDWPGIYTYLIKEEPEA